MIEEFGENLGAKIIGNKEDSTEVKHEIESITHYWRDLVENFNFVFKPLMANIANQLKKFWVSQIVENNSKQVLKMVKYSKYLFIWSGRFQFLEENSRLSFIQVEDSEVGQNIHFNFCYLLLLIFSCNFCYFRSYDFISLILGVLRLS